MWRHEEDWTNSLEKMWCVGDHCSFRAWDVELRVMVSSTFAASLTCLSLFSCDSILFSISSSLSFLGGSILLEEPRLVSLLLLLTQLVFLCQLSTYLRAFSLFCLSPSNWQLLSHYFSLRNLARCSVLEIFSKPKTKTKIKIVFLIKSKFNNGSPPKNIIFILLSLSKREI